MAICQICQIPDAGAPVFPVHHLPNPNETALEANHENHNYHVECLSDLIENLDEEAICPVCARTVDRIGNVSLEKTVLAVNETDDELAARLSRVTHSVIISHGPNLSNEIIQRIFQLPNLSAITLSNVSWHNLKLHNLPPHLNALILNHCPRLSEVIIDRLPGHIRLLSVRECPRIKKAAIQRFQHTHPLCTIDLF
jgi:hypothetical protein